MRTLLIALCCIFGLPTASARVMPHPHDDGPPADEERPAGYRPRVNYLLQCAGCHLEDGRGAAAIGVPKMKDFVGRFLQIEGGREFLLRVPGVSQSALSDGELAELLNWMLNGDIAGASRPAAFQPYTAEEVTRHRRNPLMDLPGTRTRLLGAMREQGIAIDDGFAR